MRLSRSCSSPSPGDGQRRLDVSDPPATDGAPDQPVRGSSPTLNSALNNLLAAHARDLYELETWITSGDDSERAERISVGHKFRQCLNNPNETSLDISNCPNLTSLPPFPRNLTCLSVSFCQKLPALSDLSRCKQLESLTLERLNALAATPDLSQCKGLKNVTLRHSPLVTALPGLSQCKQLEHFDVSFFDALTALEDLSQCKKLKTLHLSFCGSLTTLPDLSHHERLEVLAFRYLDETVAHLNLSQCNDLRNVWLTSCPGLTQLPSLAHLIQLRQLDLSGLALTSVPEDILSLHPDCRIDIDASRLSDGVRNRLAAAVNQPNYAGPRINYQMAGPGTSIEILPIDQAVAAWRDEAAPLVSIALDPAVWAGFPAQDNAKSFATFLARIRETNDYRNATPAIKAATRQRVATMLNQLQGDPALRETCFNLAFEATESCGDRVALRLLDMEMQCLVSKTNAEIKSGKHDTDPQSLIDLCKGQYRLQVLTRLAKEKVATMNFCDEIEVHLGYLVQLSSTYALPTQVSTMLYPRCSGLAAKDIAAAKLKLGNDGVSDQAANANNLAYISFLAASPLMRSLLERQCGPEMVAVKDASERKIESEKERIADDMDKLNADSPGYLENSKQLMEQHRQLETTIPAGFTRPVLMNFMAQRGISASL